MNEYLNDLKAGGRVMKAKDMFEKQFYKKLPKKYNKNMILYEQVEDLKRGIHCPHGKKIVYFSLSHKTIQYSPYYGYTMDEFKAIQKQIEELGW